MADALGQIAWLLTQSPLHRELKIRVLETVFMPAILAEQFRLFRFGALPQTPDMASLENLGLSRESLEKMPLGVAVWARLSPEALQKVERGEMIAPSEWQSGDEICVIEMVAPYANAENKLAEAMLLDLANSPFKATPFSVFRTDVATGRRERTVISNHL
ncbi:RTX toxin-activating protein C [Hyphomonas polymorpha PS728]|uniref:RTX toxin-activating lysine-acyltransferase n=1 Tax=Hyphomonas polymorpha PS728 TaxID=1280954 RepID=A0A062V5T7_9PROT|nr:toxin-activating lysine-acyltransferase [Hyphomonas polymorpha]KCZ97336.1 RTX toxin-activating protein C [Hyphomonas polymorpha PS728]